MSKQPAGLKSFGSGDKAGLIKKRGKLKIFFSYATGAGKTLAMLEAASAVKNSGLDVVVGYIKPQLAPESQQVLAGLELLSYQPAPAGEEFTPEFFEPEQPPEFDLDAAMARRPQIIIVDELARNNAPASRNKKRYQDIGELLQAGIDVYTTMDVQNIESLNDIVTSITGFVEQERVPDNIFDEADQVVMVDIEPDELLSRLSRIKGGWDLAAGKVLPRESLIALRELALRRAADRVSKRAKRSSLTLNHKEFYTEEHVLICLSGSPSNAKVIRAAARMADAFHGLFTALFVEKSDARELDNSAKARLEENSKLAEQLGARIVTVYGDDIASQIAEYAKAGGVSKIIIGRSNTKKSFFSRQPNLVERLITLAPNLDIYIIPEDSPPFAGRRQLPKKLTLTDTFKTLGLLSLSSFVSLWFYRLGLNEANIVTIYILGVLFTVLTTEGPVYGIIASVLGVTVFNFLFIEPRFTLHVYDTGTLVTFVIMLIASFAISTLTVRVRRKAVQSAGKAYRTEVLLETSRKLQQATSQSEIFARTAHQMIKLLGRAVLIYPVESKGLGEAQFFPLDEGGADKAGLYITPEEEKVARWVWHNNKHAGATTNTHDGAKCLYLAVRSQSRVFAVMGIVMAGTPPLDAFEKNLLIAMLGECALALEKEELNETKNRISVRAQKEELRADMLRAVSHDLRTPLTSISGNAAILASRAGSLSEEKKHELYTDIYDDALWLVNLVENLLSVTRMEKGTMSIHMEPELVDAVIREALSRLERQSAGYAIKVTLEDDLLLARMDSRLIAQVLINLVDNALKYTPAGSVITIAAQQEKEWVVISVADNGAGIPDDKKEKLFEMFYTDDGRKGDRRRGLGLGLFLCRSIVKAHGGIIGVRDNQPQGAVFYFTLPAATEETRVTVDE